LMSIFDDKFLRSVEDPVGDEGSGGATTHTHTYGTSEVDTFSLAAHSHDGSSYIHDHLHYLLYKQKEIFQTGVTSAFSLGILDSGVADGTWTDTGGNVFDLSNVQDYPGIAASGSGNVAMAQVYQPSDSTQATLSGSTGISNPVTLTLTSPSTFPTGATNLPSYFKLLFCYKGTYPPPVIPPI